MGGESGLETGIPARLTPAEGRRFGLLVGGAFLLLAGISFWRGHTIAPRILAALGGALALAGIVIPHRLGSVHRQWMRMALAISKVTTPLFMGIVYYVVLTPTGLLMRLFGRNPLRHGKPGENVWVPRGRGDEPRTSMQRQF